jgi:hypothetical protein
MTNACAVVPMILQHIDERALHLALTLLRDADREANRTSLTFASST